MKTTTNKYLSALAICDIFVLIFSVLITSNSFIKGMYLLILTVYIWISNLNGLNNALLNLDFNKKKHHY